ncbi:MAG: four helix bundle protein [Chitinophagales bacterium]|nr:four helix bundle protein [Chitinophagales bacterium]
MATIKRFEDLEAWQLSSELSKSIFQLTKKEGFNKDYKLKDQINDASGSAMDNIAEGFGRGGRNEFVNFLSVTNGSLNEVKSQLYRALDREYISQNEFDTMYQLAENATGKTVNSIKYLNSSTHSGTKFKDRTASKSTAPNNSKPKT